MKVDLFAMLLQTSKCGKNLVLEIKMLHDIMPPEQNGKKSDETSRILYGHVDFPEMNDRIEW